MKKSLQPVEQANIKETSYLSSSIKNPTNVQPPNDDKGVT